MRKYFSLFFVPALLLAVICLWRYQVWHAREWPTALEPVFGVGQALRFEYEQSGEAQFLGSLQQTQVDFAGTFWVDRGEVGRLSLTPKQSSLKYRVNSKNLEKALENQLRESIELSLGDDQRIKHLWFAPVAGDSAQALWRDLLARSQFVTDLDRRPTWEVTEEDDNGTYQVVYQIVGGDPDLFVVEKRILPANGMWVDGVLHYTWERRSGKFVGVVGEQNFHIRRDVGMAANWKLRIRLTAETGVRSPAAKRKHFTMTTSHLAREADTLGGELAKRRAERRQHELTLGTDTEETLRERLAQLTRAGRDAPSRDKRDAVLKLYAYVTLYPENAADLAETLHQADADSAEFSYITGALSQVGHNEAQAALIAAIESVSHDGRKLAALIPALAMVPYPNPQTQSKLESLRERDDALLALGILASRLATREPQRAARVLEQLEAELNQANSVERRAAVLAGLGNTGMNAVADLALAWLRDSEPTLRVAAARAVRLVASDQALSPVIETIRQETDEMVRYEAVRALGYRVRGVEILSKQAEIYKQESSAMIRGQLIRNLWSGRAAYGYAEVVVRRAADEDVSQEVKQIAKTLLAGELAVAE